MSSTMSLSLCSRQAEFCCHAATQSHSIIVRSIKSCGYPGRCESCLSFRSRCFFFYFFIFLPVFFVSQQLIPVTPLSPSPPLTPNLLPPTASLHLSSLLPPLLSPPRGPGGDDEGAQYQGKSSQGISSPLSFIFSVPRLRFCGAQHSN